MNLLKLLRDADRKLDTGEITIGEYKKIIAPLKDVVPVKRGRWIDIDSETYTWKIRCSNCGHERSMMSTGQIYPMYCENCGTRMDGKEGDQNG